MKRKYVRPKMDVVAIMRHRILVGSDQQDQLTVKRSSGGTNEETEVGW